MELSEGTAATIKKGAATTLQNPKQYIDDDLFGFMGTEQATAQQKGKATKRTSPVRVSPLVAFDRYAGDLDFGTNYMGVGAGGDPNIFETEIHSGLYRGTILIELDRVGCFDGQGGGAKDEIAPEEKAARVIGLLTAFKNLWTSARQSRFLADISPKFVAGALLTVKNPIFLETVLPTGNGDMTAGGAGNSIGVNTELLAETVKDYDAEILSYVFGAKGGLFTSVPEDTKSVGDAFEDMCGWVKKYYTTTAHKG